MQFTTETSSLAVLGIGFVLGLQHAIEADHLAAVSTIVSEKKNLLTASIVGGMWGIGHTISLFVVGALVIFLKLQVSEAVETKLEALVGVMLVVLGVNALRKLFTTHAHAHIHQHGEREHVHFHTHGEEPAESHHRYSPRSILIGVVHGLAGSAALMLLIIPTISSPLLGLAYILIFGIGSIGGMMAMSLLIGLPFHFTANRFDLLNKGIRLCAGVFSLGLGLLIIREKLFLA
jgi:sulfite exporter TauE/SafE